MDERFAIGVDLGATNFRLGVVSDKGKILESHMGEVGKVRDPETVVKLLESHVKRLRDAWPDLVGAGVGIPGIIDQGEGIVYQSPHYPHWKDVGFAKIMGQAFDLPVVIDNDANMIALGEGWQGAGKDLNNFLMITLGTGIGGGIVYDGRIWHGDHGFAGEIGHMVIDFEGPLCNCGGRGCWEMFASATGIKYLVENLDEPHKETFLKSIHSDYNKVTPALLFDLAKDGDIFSSLVWKKFGSYLGAGCASLVNVLGIMDVVIGGGVSRAWDFFIAPAEKEFARRTYKRTANLVKFHRAVLRDDAGIIGSARSVF